MSPTLTSPHRSPRRAAGGPEQPRYVQTVAHYAGLAGLSIEALADRTGISRDRIAAMIRGRLPVEGGDCLRLAGVLGVRPEEIQSGSPVVPGSGAVSGAALLAAHDQAGMPLPGPAVTRTEFEQALWELGLRDAPPAGPRVPARRIAAEEGVAVDASWIGRTTWRRVFGASRCGWCRRRHEGPCCR